MVTQISVQPRPLLTTLGWSEFFDAQVTPEEQHLEPLRIATVHRARMTAESATGPVKLQLPPHTNTAHYAVGDWILAEPQTHMIERRLARKTLLERRTENSRDSQLIAANVDTLFIVSSCNDDFSAARLERYLALANEAGTTPVIVLTKADKVEDSTPYREAALQLQRDVAVVVLNAQVPEAAEALAQWCGPGQTVALVGSSGVGKSSLLNTLTDKAPEEAQLTGSIRESDARGRHTTTSRSLHAIAGGAQVIDTPGVRTLYVSGTGAGLDLLFAEITEVMTECRFRDCTHMHEPGCAIQAAVAKGAIDPERLERWRKLQEENTSNTPVYAGPRGNKKIVPPGKRW